MIRHSAMTVAIFLMVLVAETALGRSAVDVRVKETGLVLTAAPAYCIVEHNVGRIALAVTNQGVFGDGLSSAGTTDCFTGQPVHACEYPIGSNTRYLFAGAFWIGAVVGNDTLVSTGADGWSIAANEFHPDETPLGHMIFRSIVDPTEPEFEGAISEQDYIAVYYDTCLNCPGVTADQVDGRPHRPLNLKITQRSMAWSYVYAEDFILFDFAIENIGAEALDDVYLGIYVDADVHSRFVQGAQDDITGFRETLPAWYLPGQCGSFDDEVNLAWIADNNGDLGVYAVPHITATSLLRFPSYPPQISANWWVSNGNRSLDFGPQHYDTFRDFGGGATGTPGGDRNKYHLLRNGEWDYDQIFTASIDALDTLWVLPNQIIAPGLSDGADARYLLSFGPFDLYPGQERPLAFAYVGGENFHTDPSNGANLPYNPWQFYDNVNFTDLAMNAMWAKWVYDNPGVDSDSDGYAGEFRVCEGDTFWYEGDGVPDFRAAGSPSAPVFWSGWIEPMADGFWIRWNGLGCETTPDIFSRRQDFEGYKVYLSTSGAPSSFAVQASYDLEDYFKYYWRPSGWTLGGRFTTEELRCLYAPGGCGNPSWDPDDYSGPPHIFFYVDSVFYFEPVGLNLSELGIETPIIKRYPLAPEPPTLDRDSIPPGQEGMYLTDDGYFKYYEYELTISNLLPDNPYWISVTAMDYGSFISGVPPLESSVMDNALQVSTLGCCVGPTGNVDGDPADIADIGDVHVMINHLFITLEPLDCSEEADLDYSGEVDIGDLTLLICALYVYVVSLPPCP